MLYTAENVKDCKSIEIYYNTTKLLPKDYLILWVDTDEGVAEITTGYEYKEGYRAPLINFVDEYSAGEDGVHTYLLYGDFKVNLVC